MRKKAAFVDRAYHQRTGSTLFMINFLRREYDVDLYWDRSQQRSGRPDIYEIGRNYDIMVLFQQMQHPDLLRDIPPCRNTVLIPMYDCDRFCTDAELLKFYNYKFLNFTRVMHERIRGLQMVSECVQYYPDPVAFPCINDFSVLKGFFWQRIEDLGWETVGRLIEGVPFTDFHIHYAPVPQQQHIPLLSRKERESRNITTSPWFEKKSDYISLLREYNVFFAPRLCEGIGSAFLEALAMGKCVVAPDRPSMNEYIRSGVNGILYDPRDPRPLDLSGAAGIGRAAREVTVMGRLKWLTEGERIMELIERPVTSFKRKTGFFVLRRKAVVFLKQSQNPFISFLRRIYISCRSVFRTGKSRTRRKKLPV